MVHGGGTVLVVLHIARTQVHIQTRAKNSHGHRVFTAYSVSREFAINTLRVDLNPLKKKATSF